MEAIIQLSITQEATILYSYNYMRQLEHLAHWLYKGSYVDSLLLHNQRGAFLPYQVDPPANLAQLPKSLPLPIKYARNLNPRRSRFLVRMTGQRQMI